MVQNKNNDDDDDERLDRDPKDLYGTTSCSTKDKSNGKGKMFVTLLH